jgi:hypothetical protein
MAQILPPPPIEEPAGSFTWVDWYNRLRNLINGVNIAWASIDKAGSNLSDLQTRQHNSLQSIQGGALNDWFHLTSAQATEATNARSSRGVDTTDYIIVDSTTNGFTMKSPNGHYWVATISNAGVVTWTDIGTTKP